MVLTVSVEIIPYSLKKLIMHRYFYPVTFALVAMSSRKLLSICLFLH